MSESKDQDLENISNQSVVADETLKEISATPLQGLQEGNNVAAESVVTEEKSIEEVDQMLTEADPDFTKTIHQIQANAEDLNKGPLSIVSIKEKFNWKKTLTNFKSLKYILLLLVILAIFLLGLFLTWSQSIRFFKDQLFITSYSDLGVMVHDYDSKEDMEIFYDNPRFTKNVMSVSRMIVNVKSSASSGSNPMLALEVNVEGLSPEAIIELKDREAEFKHLLIRQAEDFTYDELITTAGKQNICDQFRLVINANLTRGQIRKVYLKSFVIKP